jgi:ferredoxin
MKVFSTLRSARIISGILVLLISIVFFLTRGAVNIENSIFEKLTSSVQIFLSMQIIPSLLNIFSGHLSLIVIFGSIIAITILFGRVYCASFCPLGVLQDFFSFIGRPFRNKTFHTMKGFRIIWYTSMIGTVILFSFGLSSLAGFLDPYSLFGKLISYGVRPLAIQSYNFIGNIFDYFGMYLMTPIQDTTFIPLLTLVSGLILLFLVIASALRGRLFCNVLCPVGAFLGIVSRFSRYKLSISSACISCGKCVSSCRAGCIQENPYTIEDDRCVRCLDCIVVCPVHAISTAKITQQKQTNNSDQSGTLTRRDVLGIGFLASIAAVLPKKLFAQDVFFDSSRFPIPPGASTKSHFERHCTSCGLCISKCPTGVMRPSFTDKGLAEFMQPLLDYSRNFCEYGCTVCSRVCPTSALSPLKREAKQLLSIGEVHFIQSRCIVETEKTACGACAEVCPTNAVTMIPYAKGLTIPFTDLSLCIGCGACEYQCPVRPSRAIYVTGRNVHTNISVKKLQPLPEKNPEKKTIKPSGDFPF